jgi:hypothetical protein
MLECILAQLAPYTKLYPCIAKSRWVGPEVTEANRYDMYCMRKITCLDSILFPIGAASLRSLSAIEIDTIAWGRFPLRQESYIHPQIIVYLILRIATSFLNPRAGPLQKKVTQPWETYCINGQRPWDIPTIWFTSKTWAISNRSTGIKNLLLYKFRAGIWHYHDCSCSTCQPSATLGSFQRFTTDDDLDDWLNTWLITVAV